MKKKEKKHSAPKKAPSAYLFYVDDNIEKLKLEGKFKNEKTDMPHLPSIMKELSSRWKSLNDEGKQKYLKKAKSEYEKALEEYKMSKEGKKEPKEEEKVKTQDDELNEGGESHERDIFLDDEVDDEENLGRILSASKSDFSRPGVSSLSEVKDFPRIGDSVFSKASFKRLVMSITQDYICDVKFRQGAFDVIQEATETYLSGLLQDAKVCADHAKRNTVFARDISLARRVRNDQF